MPRKITETVAWVRSHESALAVMLRKELQRLLWLDRGTHVRTWVTAADLAARVASSEGIVARILRPMWEDTRIVERRFLRDDTALYRMVEPHDEHVITWLEAKDAENAERAFRRIGTWAREGEA